MRILAEEICGPARSLLETKGHEVITISEVCSGLIFGKPAPQDCDVLWARLVPLAKTSEWKCDSLKVVACPCTDVSHLPLEEFNRRGIKVLSLRDTDVLPTITATAEHTIGLILALVRKIPSAVESVNRGEWDRYRFMGRELRDMEALIIGHGRVGELVTCMIHPFVCLPYPIDREQIAEFIPHRLGEWDIVTMHVDLNDSTRGMCNAEFFGAMKSGSFFVNTSRGAIVDESALLAALRSGHLAGAALDVVCGEPNEINPELIVFAREEPEKLIITPHVGGCAAEAIEKAEVALAKRLVEELHAP